MLALHLPGIREGDWKRLIGGGRRMIDYVPFLFSNFLSPSGIRCPTFLYCSLLTGVLSRMVEFTNDLASRLTELVRLLAKQ